MTCADRAVLSTIAQALALADELGPGIGLAVDVYHVWWDPALAAGIAAARGRILGFHICDWLVPTRHLLTDRGMMGDGVIDLPSIRRMVEAAGYAGLVEAEIMSAANWWRRDPDEVLATVKARFATAV
jgi:sugar phosphate isomerase/epimerase